MYMKQRARRPKTEGLRSSPGHTLVDVMLAMAVLVFSATALIGIHLSSALAVRRSRNQELATTAARQQLDAWREIGFDGLPSNDVGKASAVRTFAPPAELPSATGTVTFEYLDKAMTVSAVDTGRRRLVARVAWQGRRQDAGAVILTTLIIR